MRTEHCLLARLTNEVGSGHLRFFRVVVTGGMTVGLLLLTSFGLIEAMEHATQARLQNDSSLRADKSLAHGNELPVAPYLMLVAGTRNSSLTQSQLALLDRSAYDGLAVRFIAQYDTTPPPSTAEMTSSIADWKKSTRKDIWPWLFLNRMIGRDPELDTPYGRDPYFTRIRGADLDGSAGAQKDFLQIWQNSLRAANQAHAPGIVADFELYVNYRGYEPVLLAKQIGKSTQEVLELLHQLGVRLADIAGKEYPNAKLWFLFTDLGQYGWKVENNVKYYPTPAYIVLGLLDEIRDKKYPLTVISGGEVGLEYCSFSLDHLKRKIQGRGKDFEQHLQSYPGTLELGGTIILWPDRESRTEFMTQGPCGRSDAATVEELQPYLELLFATYKYDWIYGTHNSGYDPFNASTAPRFDSVIRKAKGNVASRLPH